MPQETGDSPAGTPGDSAPPDTGPLDLTDLPAGATVLRHARLVDANGVREDRDLIIVSDLIWGDIATREDWPDDATLVDLDGASVTPGLIDAHVHLFGSGTTSWVGDTLAANLAAQLAWGVVGVADLGAPTEIYTLRDRIAAGEILGPRVLATGPFLTAAGSHPCETVDDPHTCRYVDGDGPDAVAELADADAIKVALADAAFTPWPTPRLDLGDLAEIVEAASTAGQPVYAHVDAPEDTEDAIDAGVAVLAHPVFSEIVATTPEAQVLSTLSAFSGTPDLLDGDLLADDLSHTPAEVRAQWTWLAAHPDAFEDGWIEGSADWDAAARANIATALTEARPVIAGSDAGYWFVPHGLGLHRELDALVAAGMTPLQALTAATALPAALHGWEDLGTLDAGKRADLLVLDGHPDEDIAALRQIRAIYLGGQVLDLGDLLVTPASAPAGAFCLDDRDCADGACDLVQHTCAAACDTPYDRVGSCDADTWCMPQDGVDTTTEGVCHEGGGCDLYAQDCAPEIYGDNCAPVDLDTNTCWPSGPQTAGEACSWTDPDLYCEQGLYCSWITYKCYTLCDPDAADPCARGTACVRQSIEGQPWFGLCL